MRRAPATLMVLACLAGAAPGQAATVTAVFTPSGDASREAKQAVVHAAEQALAKSARKASSQGAPVEDSTLVLGCSINEAACLQRVAVTLGVSELLYGALERAGSKLRLRMTLSNAHADVLATIDETYEPAELAEQAEQGFLLMLTPRKQVELGTLVISTKPDGAEIYVDGGKAGRAPLELQVAAGPHVVEARQGEARETREVHVPLGRVGAVFDLRRSLASATPPPPFDLGRASFPSVALSGLGLGLLGAGAALAFNASSLQTDFDAQVSMLPAAPLDRDLPRLRALDDLADRGEQRALLSKVAFIAGGTALVGGLLLLISEAGDSDADAPLSDGTGEARARLEGRW